MIPRKNTHAHLLTRFIYSSFTKRIMSKETGITAKKEDNFSEWYTQVLLKGELVDYSPVSGCYVIRPNAVFIWEQVQKWFDREIQKIGVRNAFFPLLIPESLLNKEAKHVEGFAPEVAWVTHGGNAKLPERLAIRPTSETIMYDTFSKWVQSHRELPLRINQWCNIVRWEFKHPTPFLRGREFHWQEGHTVHETKESADEEVYYILDLYEKVYKELFAIPVLKGRKSNDEKFAGAEYSTSCEAFLPNGKAVQGCTSHMLGQNFSKAFNIQYLDEQGQNKYAWQNSWGISTRTLGVMVMTHSDNKGVILPPRVAWLQAVIVPILFDDTKEKVLKAASEVKKVLDKFRVHIDDRDDHTPGWKFNQWELKGVPLRIEIGPKDIAHQQVVIVRRDTGEKQNVPFNALSAKVTRLLETIQQELYQRAKTCVDENTIDVSSLQQAIQAKNKLMKALWCDTEECHEIIKDKTGAKCLVLTEGKGKCFQCGKPAKGLAYFAKSY